MNKPSDPMLEEFRLVRESNIASERDLDELASRISELFTEDCLLDDTMSDDIVRGRAQLDDYSKSLFGPLSNVTIHPEEIIDAGNTSTMVLVISGEHTAEWFGVPATGKRVRFKAIAIYRCNDDNTMVKHETLSYDTGYVIRQLKG